MTSTPLLRPVNASELDALHDLITRIERAEDQPYLTAKDEVTEMFDDQLNPASQNLRVLESDGRLVGWAHVTHSPSGQKLERAILRGGVHPNTKGQGLGKLLLAWQTKRASERLAETPHELEAIVLVERYSWQDDKDALFTAGGYQPARYFDELQRPLADDLPPIDDLGGTTIVPWQPEHTEPARLVYNVAFLDHWGTTPRSEQAWESDVIDNFGRRLNLSFVAFAGDQMVGYCLNSHYPDDEEMTGRRDGWIDSICTLASHRGSGIASSLIVHSLHAFAAANLNSSMLGVDSDNPTGAYGIYERLGYRPLHRHVSHVRTVRQGEAPVQMY